MSNILFHLRPFFNHFADNSRRDSLTHSAHLCSVSTHNHSSGCSCSSHQQQLKTHCTVGFNPINASPLSKQTQRARFVYWCRYHIDDKICKFIEATGRSFKRWVFSWLPWTNCSTYSIASGSSSVALLLAKAAPSVTFVVDVQNLSRSNQGLTAFTHVNSVDIRLVTKSCVDEERIFVKLDPYWMPVVRSLLPLPYPEASVTTRIQWRMRRKWVPFRLHGWH